MSEKTAEQKLRDDVARLRAVLITVLGWMGQSANSPLNRDEIKQLIRMAEGEEEE